MAAPPMVPRPPRLLIHLPSESPRTLSREEKKNDQQGGGPGKGLAVGELLDSGPGDVDTNAYTGEHDGGQVDHVGKPITPAGKEAMLFTEAALGPEIDATFTRPLLR